MESDVVATRDLLVLLLLPFSSFIRLAQAS